MLRILLLLLVSFCYSCYALPELTSYTVDRLNEKIATQLRQRLSQLQSEEDWAVFVSKQLPGAGVVVARRGKVIGRFGKSLVPWLGEGWEKSFMLGLYHGEEVFEAQAAHVFSRQTRWSDLLAESGRFRSIFTRNQTGVMYWCSNDAYQVLILFQDIDFPVYQWWEQAYQGLAQSQVSQIKGLFQIDQPVIVSLILLFLILLGFRKSIYCRIRFAYRLSNNLLLVQCAALTILIVFLHFFIEARAKELQYAWTHDSLEKIRKLEDGFLDYLDDYGTELRQQSQEGDGFQLRSGGYLGIGNSKGKVTETLSGSGKANRALFCKIYPYFLYGRKPPQSLLKKLRTCTEESALVGLTNDRAIGPIAQNLATAESGRFRITTSLGGRHAIWWQMRENGSDHEVLLVFHRTEELLFDYLKQIIKESRYHLATLDLRSNQMIQTGSFPDEGLGHLRQDPGELLRVISLQNGFLLQTRGERFPEIIFQCYLERSELYRELLDVTAMAWGLVFVALTLGLLMGLGFLSQFKGRIFRLQLLLQSAESGYVITNSAQKLQGNDELSRLAHDMQVMLEELEESRRVLPFVAKEILDLFTGQDGRLLESIGGQATVVFSDIRSFTSISERESPQAVVDMLNDYFALWQTEVQRRGGVIERFIGDAVVAVFLREKIQHHEQAAIETAMAVRRGLNQLNQNRQKDGLFSYNNGIGIATAMVEFSVIGDETKRHLYSHSAAVMEAERLESLTKSGKYSCIYVDQAVYLCLRESYDFVEAGEEKVYELCSIS